VKGLDAINGTPVLDIKPYKKKIIEKDGENKPDEIIQIKEAEKELYK
jgi:tRNA (Thr-GGU) A37 N-methylase